MRRLARPVVALGLLLATLPLALFIYRGILQITFFNQLHVLAIYLVLGMFLDWIGVAMLTLPIFVPIVEQLGYSPIWFGILFAVNMQVSFLSPPFGPAAFYLKGVAPPEISLKDIFVSLLPFIAIQLCVLFALLFWPNLAMWLV